MFADVGGFCLVGKVNKVAEDSVSLLTHGVFNVFLGIKVARPRCLLREATNYGGCCGTLGHFFRVGVQRGRVATQRQPRRGRLAFLNLSYLLTLCNDGVYGLLSVMKVGSEVRFRVYRSSAANYAGSRPKQDSNCGCACFAS